MARAIAAFLAVFLLLGPCPPVRSQEELADQVKKAIQKGVDHLRKTTKFGSNQLNGKYTTGPRALVGWTLPEAGVDAKDDFVKRLADETRLACIGMDQTYNISVAIIFLDKLGDPGDKALIQSLALRLLGGQNKLGG